MAPGGHSASFPPDLHGVRAGGTWLSGPSAEAGELSAGWFIAAEGVGVPTTGVTAFGDWAESTAAVERSRPAVKMMRIFIEAPRSRPTGRGCGFCKNGTPRSR